MIQPPPKNQQKPHKALNLKLILYKKFLNISITCKKKLFKPLEFNFQPSTQSLFILSRFKIYISNLKLGIA